jgi:hypothetical protein
MLRPLVRLAERIAACTARPNWTLLAVSSLISGVLVWTMRAFFAEAG